MDQVSGAATQPSPLAAVTSAAKSDIGQKREENQDSFGTVDTPQFRLFMVADGMGGVKGGATASALAISVMTKQLSAAEILDVEKVEESLQIANAQIHRKGLEEPGLAGMGTTFVGLGFQGHQMMVINVGDSRAYRFRNGEVRQLTDDHTLVNELVKQGAITAEQAVNHPVSHMLTRSLGPTSELMVDCWFEHEAPVEQDCYLLCSDGLYNLVNENEMMAAFNEHPLDKVPEVLVALANKRGGSDNITIIVARIGEGYGQTLADVSEEVEIATAEAAQMEDFTEESEKTVEISADDEKTIELEHIAEEGNGHDEVVNSGEAKGSQGSKDSTSDVQVASAAVEDGQPSASRAEPQTATKPEPSPAAATDGPEPVSDAYSQLARDLQAPLSLRGLSPFVIGLFALAFGGGMLVSEWGCSRKATHQRASNHVPSPPTTISAQPTASSPESTPVLSSSPLEVATAVASEQPTTIPTAPSHEVLTNTDNTSVLLARRNYVRQKIAALEEKIGAFDRPLSNTVAKILDRATSERQRLQNESDEVRSKIEVATRRLAVWLGRRRKFQETDPLNLATEISVSSAEVKALKEELDRATWEYMKESEALQFNPSDPRQQRLVQEAISKRRQSINNMSAAVKKAIDQATEDAEHEIADLILKRDQTDAQLNDLKRENQFVKILMGADKQAKTDLLDELRRERDTLQADLEELERVISQTPQ